MSDFFSWLFTTDHLQDFSILTLCFCIVMSGRAIDRHNRQISKLQREVRELTRRCNEFAHSHNSPEERGASRRTE
jgi:hypothetical protein